MIETASEKFDFLDEKLSKKYIDDAIKNLGKKKQAYLKNEKLSAK